MMEKIINFLKAFLVSASCVLVLFEMPNFINTSAIADQDVSTISKAIFISLFVICTIIGAVVSIKKPNVPLQNIALLFVGANIILLAFLNIYNIQMLLPLLKTNSIGLVVMWVSRILGGLTGAFCGLAIGPLLKKEIIPYIGIVLGGAGVYLICLLCPQTISYEIVFYTIGFLIFVSQIISVFSKKPTSNN